MSSPAPKLPPTERDFDVYQFVAIETHSTREAAAQFGLSQTRVRQVLEKVVGFLAETAPVEAGLSEEQRLGVAEQAAAMRLHFLYGQALDAWRTSQGPICTIREAASGEVKTTRPGFGEVRFLGAAARIALLAAKVPWSGVGLCVKEEDSTEANEGNEEERREAPTRSVSEGHSTQARSASEGAVKVTSSYETSTPAPAWAVAPVSIGPHPDPLPAGEGEYGNPPVGACSELAVSRGLGEEVAAGTADASALIERLCFERAERKSRIEEVVSAPAQLADEGEMFRERPFTKKERKARRRKLERLMRAG